MNIVFVLFVLVIPFIFSGCEDDKHYHYHEAEHHHDDESGGSSRPSPSSTTPSVEDREYHEDNDHVDAPWGDATTTIHHRLFEYEEGSAEKKAGFVGYKNIAHSDKKGFTIVNYKKDGTSITEEVRF